MGILVSRKAPFLLSPVRPEESHVSFDRAWTSSLDEIQREMERYLHHVTQKKPHPVVFSRRTWEPPMDVYETPESIVAIVDLSGVAEQDIELTVARDSLTVRGDRRDQPGQRPDRTYSLLEIPFGPFERTVRLAAAVDPDDARASYHSGFLEVVMPKLRAAGPHHVPVVQA